MSLIPEAFTYEYEVGSVNNIPIVLRFKLPAREVEAALIKQKAEGAVAVIKRGLALVAAEHKKKIEHTAPSGTEKKSNIVLPRGFGG